MVPLRPLGLGDLFDGAFQTIRRNPRAVIGMAALVTAAFMVPPMLITLAVAAAGGLDAVLPPELLSWETGGGSTATSGVEMSAGAELANVLGSLFSFLATVVLTGMVVHVVAEAVLGRRSTIGDAWRVARGRLLRLLGLVVLSALLFMVLLGLAVGLAVVLGVVGHPVVGVLSGIVLVLGALAVGADLQVRYFLLATPALVLERTGVVGALRRGGLLSRGQFWRIFGIQLLTGVLVVVASQVLAAPLTALMLLGPTVLPAGTTGVLVLSMASYLSTIVVTAVTTPFTAAVTVLQYVDQRIRKEGLDVELMVAAGHGAR